MADSYDLVVIGDGPGGPLDYLVLVLRILLAGLSVSVLYTALSLAVSSFTARRAAASATIILMLLTSAIFVSSLTDQEGGAGWSPNLVVFDFITLPLALVFHIFGEAEQIDRPYDDVSRTVLLLANLAWIVLFAAITRWRYQKMTVTR